MKKDKGFSLTELIVVIAVIALLASLLLPAMSSAKKRAQGAYCRNNLRQIGTALASYTAEHSQYPLFTSFSENKKWYDTLKPYLPNGWSNGVYVCPAYRGIVFDGRVDGNSMYASAGSYGWNFGSCSEQEQYLYGLVSAYPYLLFDEEQIREDEVVAPSDFITLADSFSRSYLSEEIPIVEGAEFLSRRLHTFYNKPIAKKVKAASKRHDGYSHTAFGDAHVEAVRLSTLLMSEKESDLRRWHRDNLPHGELFQ
jgi:prepilin-type N-terminal cleavage/methylation domain-containing protein/prepilin-type processing-associated H-X9-DG protein